MGTLTPAAERNRIELVQKAFLRLLRANGSEKRLSRRQIFDHPSTTPKGPQWQFKLLKSLLLNGVIEKCSDNFSDVTYSVTKEGEAVLKTLRSDKQLLSNLLWPSRAVEEPDETEPDETGEPDEPEEAPSHDEMLAAVLKLTGASLENVVYLRRKVDNLEKTVSDMQQQLKELRDAWIE